MKKSKNNSVTSLSPEQKENRKKLVSSAAVKYQTAIDLTVKKFAGLGLTISFIPEFNFKNDWRFDYYCIELGLAIEFEGGRGHIFRNRYEGDLSKYNRAVIYGYPHLLRFVIDTLDEVYIQVFQFYRQRSKIHGGNIDSKRIDKLNEQLVPKIELSKETE